jgi:hypothetical protein
LSNKTCTNFAAVKCSITVTTGTHVEVIEAVHRDALDSMGSCAEGSVAQRPNAPTGRRSQQIIAKIQ